MLKLKVSKFTAPRLAPSWPNLILLTCVLILLTGCASGPKVITEFETIEVEVAVRTPLPGDLLEDPPGDPCALPPTVKLYFFDLDIWALCLEGENEHYARQLKRIKAANEKPPEGG